MATVTPGASTVSDIAEQVSRGTTTLDRTRMFDLGERVASLQPELTPFYTYLSRTRKATTPDFEFKAIEDRSAIQFAGENFYLNGTHDISSKSEGDTFDFTVDDNATSASAIKWLLKGMEFAIGLTDASNSNPEHIYVRVIDEPQHSSSSTSFTGRITDDPTGSIGDHSSNDNTECQVIGTSHHERTNSPDTFIEGYDDQYGYTQIFMDALDFSWRGLTVASRGGNEWNRNWANVINRHKARIERSSLVGTKKTQNGLTYTDGVVGMILRDGTPVTTDATDFTYTENTPYYRQIALASLDYDRLLQDAEVITDPARGGTRDKLVLCGRPVLTWFNQLGNGGFVDNTIGFSNSAVRANFDFDNRESAFGFMIKTLYVGDYARYHLIEEPFFRGIYKNYMAMIDLNNVRYRPLANNGYNWDTVVVKDVQANDDTGKKDMVYTDAGLEITLKETHALYSFD